MPEVVAKYESFTTPEGAVITSNTNTAEEMAEMFSGEPKEKEPEAAPEGTSDEQTQPQKPEKPLGKPRDDPRSRMLQATQQLAETKRQKDEIERRAIAAEDRLRKLLEAAPKEEAKPEPKVEKSGRPSLDDFETLEDHAEAVAKWVIKQERDAEKAERAKETEAAKAKAYQEFREKRISSFAERMNSHLEKDPQFWERQNPDVVGLKPLSVVPDGEPKGPLNALAEHFLVSEVAPALIEYFSGNPEELQRFGTFRTEGQFWYELGKVEKALGAATTATAQARTSKAAPPARPVAGGPPTNPEPALEDSDSDYFRKRLAQELRKRGR